MPNRIKQLTVVGLTLVLAGSAVHAVDARVPASVDDFHLFVLAGQSNMAGRGRVDATDRQPHARILMLNQSGKWVPAIDPLHFDKPKVVGVGPGRAFALKYASHHPEVTIGLIPCAVGGSPIAAWSPGGYHSQTHSHPWDDAIKRIKAASAAGVLKGILWHQGESDSTAALAKSYEASLHQLIERFRSETSHPDLPFIAGQMGQFAERPWTEAKMQVDAAHRTLPQKVHLTAFASSKDLQHKGDEVHFDSSSAQELGRRYFKAYLSVANTAANSSSVSSGGR